MTFLAILLGLKIIFTAIAVALPLLFFRPETLERLSGWTAPEPLWRLYGVAILALLIGYGFGLVEAMQGWIPAGVLWMGIISNGGAASLLMQARPPLRWGAIVFGAIALGLLVCLINPDLAMGTL